MAFYQVEVTTQARKEIRQLSGNMRQRVLRMLQDLKQEPRPPNSQPLDLTESNVELAIDATLHRIRLDSWRVIYLIEEDIKLVSVLAVRKRPPYQYDDLQELINN